jgi:uncharacterized membrane protein YhaH (DUF805 family)
MGEANVNYYFQAWRGAFDFKGRAQRKEYFIFTIINGVIANILFYMDNEISVIIGGVLVAAYIIPVYAVAIRRMHDQDRSGWFFFIPVVGPFFAFIDGTTGQNRFGPDPKLRGPEVDPESMANRSPIARPPEPWQCSNCNTRNAVEVSECATCGRSAPA